MAFDAFVKIDEIDGESSDEKHKDWIEIKSCDSRITQKMSTTASSAGGATAERASFQDFTFTKDLDKASPKLALACADGTHIDEIVVEFCRAGTEKIKFMEFKLTNCIISDYKMIADGRSFPLEGIAINFGRIQWSYTQQKRQGGGAAGSVAAGWDLEKNKKL